ncbi:MAG: hypothetical protein KAW12_30020 [Candidatus Aminicenantes bacterium]|nr:hypothetical protein [Candidatus Aminicenantes bacterium]
MKDEAKEKKKRVFARLIAHELKNLKSFPGGGSTGIATDAPPGGSKDFSNLWWDNDDPPPI